MKRMTNKRWEHILKGKDFVGQVLHDEMVRARKADLAHIAELEAEIKSQQRINHDLRCKRDELEATIERYEIALHKLSRLGNEPGYGNSTGNRVAQEALGDKV